MFRTALLLHTIATIVHNTFNLSLHKVKIVISRGRKIFLKEEISKMYKIEVTLLLGFLGLWFFFCLFLKLALLPLLTTPFAPNLVHHFWKPLMWPGASRDFIQNC